MRSEGISKKKRKRRGGGDLFGALPDDLLNHVLSFLPSREAVQASLLSRRWRLLWRSTPAISVSGEGDDLRLFVSTLLLRRHSAASSPPLRSFEIDAKELRIPPFDEFGDYDDDDEDRPKADPHVDVWIDHALSACHARSLTVCLDTDNGYTLWLPRCPLAFSSPHLTTLHLEQVHLLDGLLDFSCCLALLSLTLVKCRLEGEALVSPSLERLSVLRCDIQIVSDWDHTEILRTTKRILTPKVRWLQLTRWYGKYEAALFLESESMPWLVDPSIERIGLTTIYSRKQ